MPTRRAGKDRVAVRWVNDYRLVQKKCPLLELPSILLTTNLGLPMHSPSALTEHVSLNFLAGLFLLNPVHCMYSFECFPCLDPIHCNSPLLTSQVLLYAKALNESIEEHGLEVKSNGSYIVSKMRNSTIKGWFISPLVYSMNTHPFCHQE